MQGLSTSIIGRAKDRGLLSIEAVNIRDYTLERHKKVDDYPYGGGAGMLMQAQPVYDAWKSVVDRIGYKPRTVYLTPQGPTFTQPMAKDLAQEKDLILLCGHYEGIDERVLEEIVTDYVSIGDYVLTGGELPAMVMVDAISRMVPGVLTNDESGSTESFEGNLLEYPQYTRPDVFEGLRVPEILEGGNHALIAAWRRDQSVLTTAKYRPDLLDHAVLTWHDRQILRAEPRFRPAKNLHIALLHHPVRLKNRKTGTTSLTNLDIHDIARISRTYGISGFFVVTPLEDQRRLLATLLSHWTEGPGLSFNPDRAEALRLVRPEESLESAIATLTTDRGLPPFVVGTSAQPVLDKKHRERRPATTFDKVRSQLADRPVLLLLGTGHGIAPEVLEQCDAILPPLRWMDEYNHLPVRAAAAILLDRLLGDRG